MRTHRFLYVALTILTSSLASVSFAQELARMAITDFDNKVGVDSSICTAMVDMMTTAIAKSGKFALVERDAISKLAEEQNFGQSGAVDASSAVKIGDVLGADYILIGAVTEINAGESQGVSLGGIQIHTNKVSLAVDVRVVDCATSELKLAETFREERGGSALQLGGAGFSANEGTGGEMARAMIDAIAAKVCAAVYPPTVLQGDGATVTLNYGDMMFKVGDAYDIVQLGDAITDPATGKVLGNARTVIGAVEIAQVDSKMTVARVVSGSAPLGSIVVERPKQEKKKSTNPRKDKRNR